MFLLIQDFIHQTRILFLVFQKVDIHKPDFISSIVALTVSIWDAPTWVSFILHS